MLAAGMKVKGLGFLVGLAALGGLAVSPVAEAADSSLFVDETGRVGIGTDNPLGNLHIAGGANADVFYGLGPDPGMGPALNFGYSGASFGQGSGFFNIRPDAAATGINPAIYFATQNLPRMVITKNGLVSLSPNAVSLTDIFVPTEALDVEGNVRANNFIAGGTTLNVPDYVFAEDYALKPLAEVAAYIRAERHLPELPSAAEVQAEGLNLSEFQMQLLKKVEELTLYTLEQEQTIQAQASTIQDLQAQGATIAALTARLAALEQARPRQ